MSLFVASSLVSATRADLDLVPKVYIDPQDYGVVPNAGVDQRAAIQAALNAASPNGRVLMPSGLYLIASGLSIPTGVILVGGPGCFIQNIALNTASYTMLQLAPNSTVENIWLHGQRFNSTGTVHGIKLGSNNGELIMIARNVHISECSGDGIYGSGGQVLVDGVDAVICNVGARLTLTDSIVSRVIVVSNSSHGVRIEDGSTNLVVRDVVAKANQGNGILITGRTSSGIVLSGFVAQGNLVCGLELFDTDGAAVNSGVCKNNGANGIAMESSRWNVFNGINLINNSATSNGSEEEIFLGDDGGGVIFSSENAFTGCSTTINATSKANYSLRENAGSGPTFVTGGKMDTGTVSDVLFVHAGSRTSAVGKVRDTDDPQTVVSANYTVLKSDYYIRVTTGVSVITITLPDPTGRRYTFIVVKADSGAGTINIVSAGTSKTINGVASLSLTTQFQSALAVANGSNYEAS